MPECRYLSFDDEPTFAALHNEVQVGGVRFLQTSTPYEALLVAQRLNDIARTPAAQRTAAIAALLAAHTDVAAAEARLARFRSSSLSASLLGGLLLADTFLVGPALLWTAYDHPLAWKILAMYVCLYLLLWGLTIWAYWQLHAAVAPDERSSRRKHALMMLASPAGAMRGLNSISVDLLAGFHPLAAARCLLGEQNFIAFARMALRDIREPLRPVYPAADMTAIAASESFRAAMQTALEQSLEQMNVSPESLLAPPAPDSADSRSWCPRCEQQYALASGQCGDCGGIELVPFDS